MELSNVQANFENEFISNAIRLDNGVANINYGFNSGGYERYQYFITADAGVLGINTVMANIQSVNFNDPNDEQWHIVGVDVNYEDTNLIDDHTGEYLEAAYDDCEE